MSSEFDPFDPKFNSTIQVEENLNKQKNNQEDNTVFGLDDYLKPDAEENQEISGLEAGIAGIISGAIKIPEGFISLGALLTDATGMTSSAAAKVESAFDKINPFEEIAQQRASGKILEALIQIGVPATLGAKIATKLATTALKAKKTGRYVNLKSKNLKKGFDKASQLNKLSNTQRFAAVTTGGAVGETFVADVENIGTFGDAFETGPTQLDREEKDNSQDDAIRKLMNRLKFGGESIATTPFVYGVFSGSKALLNRGRELAYSSSKLERFFDKIGQAFRPRGPKPQEIFERQVTEKGRLMADTNFAMEKVSRIDKEVDKMFPDIKKIFNRSGDDEKEIFLRELNELLFKGDLKKPFNSKIQNKLLKTMRKKGLKQEEADNIFTQITDVRNKMDELLDITAQTPTGVTMVKEVTNLRTLMGDRVKQYLGNTYKIFDNKDVAFYEKFKPARQHIERVKTIFKRLAEKNKNPITEETAEQIVNKILNQARQTNPKTKLPIFKFPSEITKTMGDQGPDVIKTFARSLIDDQGAVKVIGPGSKAFRQLFGSIEDARYSIFEGINKLSNTARTNQLFDEILDADAAMKAKITKDTPPGQRGFFFDSQLKAAQNFGATPLDKIVKIDPYVSNLFKDGILINRLQGQYTTEAIAEAFSNSSKVTSFMRGESGGAVGKSLSWAYRNLMLVPKAGSQYAKTILSPATHIRNVLSASSFALANGIIFENPAILAKAFSRAKGSVQVGIRKPEAMDRYRRYLELGVTNTNVRLGDIKNLMKDAKFGEGGLQIDSLLKPMFNSLGKISKGIKKTGKVAQDLYVAEDDIWKITNFEVELARREAAYAKAGIKKSLEELEEEAADIVKNTVPNYAFVGEFVRAMRSTPFGNFMSFPSEVFRTGTNIMTRALKEIKDPITGKINPFTSTNPLKGIGMKRIMGGVTAFGVLPYGLIKGSQHIFGVSNEEADAANSFVPPWSKNSQKIYMKDPDSGQLYFIDFSHTNVYDTLTRPFQTVLRNIQNGIESEEILIKGFEKGIVEAISETADPFISESIFTEAFFDIVQRGGRTRQGKELYTDQTPRGERYVRIMKHIGKTQLPSYKVFPRLLGAIEGKKRTELAGEVYEVPYELAGVFGLRPTKISPDKSLGFLLTEFNTNKREAKKEFTGGPEGVLRPLKTEKEVIERFYVANKALFNTNKKILKEINDAKKLGVSEDKIYEIFEKRGISTKELDDILAGQFRAYFPSKNIEEKFEDIALEEGTSNPFQQAVGTLDKMYESFLNQSLYGSFEPKLEDYIPSLNSEGQSALPETPGVNPQVVSTPMPAPGTISQSGLTPTEQALLSSEEQQIRLRQRGMA
tara:strand:- start:47 stop:4072 length:4026 start_codon:yes stop_codon:yes gene_type:complete